MLSYELIEYIIKNDKTEYILEKLGCHDIKEHPREFRAGLPDRPNKTALSVKKETLKIKIYNANNDSSRGDIFTLCQLIKDLSFPEANKYLHQILNLEYKFNTKIKPKIDIEDPLHLFKKIKKRAFKINIDEIPIYDEVILDDYIPYCHIDWIREGIMPHTAEKFKIGYSDRNKRIIIPHRYWSGTENDYMGIIGRTTIKEYDMLDIPKYFAIKPFSKSANLYGLQENYKGIQEAGYVVIYESEKSVLKRHSLNDHTGVSLCCHEISQEQVKILISLNVDIIIAMDKDIGIEHIRSICDKFYGIRNIYYMYDKYDLLKEKESPADKSNKIFNYLLKYKINYDEKERREYLRWQEKKVKSLSC